VAAEIRPIPEPASTTGFDPELVAFLETTRAKVASNPRDALAWLELGMVYEAHAMLELAEPCYEQSTELDAANAKAWYRLAIVRGQDGRLLPALTAIDRAIEEAPDYAPAVLKRGAWQVELGELDAAEQSYARARALAPSNAEVMLGRAQLALARAKPEDALVELDRVEVREGPNAPFAHQLRGTALARLGRESEAETELALGKDARPRLTDPWTLEVSRLQRGSANALVQASLLLGQGRAEEAAGILEELRSRGTSDVRVLERLGTAYVQLARLPDAVATFEEACALQPGDPLTRVRLGEVRAEAGEVDRALATIDEAIALDPRNPDARASKVRMLLRLERQEEALDAWDAALSHGVTDAPLAIAAGMAAVDLERLDEALAAFELATRLDPSITNGWIGLAISEHAFERDEEARAALARARALEPDHSMIAVLEAELQ
jgi:tetratricopeptide (TPR) repeat protein